MAVIPNTSASVIEQIRNLPGNCIETLSHSHAGRANLRKGSVVIQEISDQEFSSSEEDTQIKPVSTRGRGKELAVLCTALIYNIYTKCQITLLLAVL